MTRKDHLVQLVAGLGSWTPDEGKVAHAAELLSEIEKELGEIRDETGRMRTVGQQQIDAEVAKAVSAERERCASELTRVYVDLGALNGPQLTAKEVVSSGVAAIRRGGA
jgi:hypothetical protein